MLKPFETMTSAADIRTELRATLHPENTAQLYHKHVSHRQDRYDFQVFIVENSSVRNVTAPVAKLLGLKAYEERGADETPEGRYIGLHTVRARVHKPLTVSFDFWLGMRLGRELFSAEEVAAMHEAGQCRDPRPDYLIRTRSLPCV
jgi:hypothetical protein